MILTDYLKIRFRQVHCGIENSTPAVTVKPLFHHGRLVPWSIALRPGCDELYRFAGTHEEGQRMARRDTTIEREKAILVGARDFIHRRLCAHMPTATRINGDPEGQMHLSVVDKDSQRAAEVTLEKYGSGVDVFNVMEVDCRLSLASVIENVRFGIPPIVQRKPVIRTHATMDEMSADSRRIAASAPKFWLKKPETEKSR
jgi:hypothetical protein